MVQVPRFGGFDSTLALLRDPYHFVSRRSRKYDSDVFATRILLRRTICMTGPEAAEIFYDPARFSRAGAAPARLQKTLFGEGGVQGLDGEMHRRRKAMFLSLMSPDRIQDLAEIADEAWRSFARRWTDMRQVVLYDELQEMLTRSVCAWAGVPLAEAEVGRRTRELTALFDYAGAVGPRHWWSRRARTRAERWLADFIEDVRAGGIQPPEPCAAHVIAWHRDAQGELLTPRIAAVELLNVLRPTVANAVYIVFVAHALHEHPQHRDALAAGAMDAEIFVQEVRRSYPFFPSVMALVRSDFDWKGFRFPEGRRVMLDLHGTNHDPRTWEAPDEFRPARFETWDGSPCNFIPQGGGEHRVNHRCPGEWITLKLMKRAVNFLTRGIEYEVPAQDHHIDDRRLPALPRSRFVMRRVSIRE